jgi:SAM-dependent methyltransferase
VSTILKQLYGPAFYGRFDMLTSQSATTIVPMILKFLQADSVIDIGCGIGQWLAAFAAAGVSEIVGIDGPHVQRDNLCIPAGSFLAHDLRSNPPALGRRFDLALSLEVAEHLPEERAESFVSYLTALAPAVLFSAALPGQGGVGHVNEQWPWYWREIFGRYGFVCLDPIRKAIWQDPAVAIYYQQNLYLYVDPAVHQSLVNLVGVPDKFSELTLMKTTILEDLTRPGPIRLIFHRLRKKLRCLFTAPRSTTQRDGTSPDRVN